VTQIETEEWYDIHRLVHLATRIWVKKHGNAGELVEDAVRHVAVVFPADDYENRAMWRGYLPHALRLRQDPRGSSVARKVVSTEGPTWRRRPRSAVVAARAHRSMLSRRTGAQGDDAAAARSLYRSSPSSRRPFFAAGIRRSFSQHVCQASCETGQSIVDISR
jgi:hypothetical protein